MFQAEAGRGNTASVRSTREATSGTVASYAIPTNERQEKALLMDAVNGQMGVT